MARIAGVNIPSQKRVPIGLTYIHGIGRTKAAEICSKANTVLASILMRTPRLEFTTSTIPGCSTSLSMGFTS